MRVFHFERPQYCKHSTIHRSIGNLVAASESSQISGLICHLIHNVCSAAVNASSDGVSDGSAASLVVFLSNSIAETALVSCPLGRQKVLLPADTWLVACTTVCTHAHAALDQRDGTFVWKATFKAFASMLGALDVLGKPVPVDLGTKVTILASIIFYFLLCHVLFTQTGTYLQQC